MRKNQKKSHKPLNINVLFVAVVFLILAGTVGLLIGAIYLFEALELVQVEAVQIPGWLFILLLAVSSVTLGTFMSYIVSRYVLKTSSKVVAGLEKLAAGDFSERIDLGNNGAQKQLGYAFNKLAQELEDTKMLRADFINEFAHEFKTPIVSIKGFAELLTDKNITEEQRSEYQNIIIEETERLSDLAHNYLALTKVEKQNILTDLVEYNLSEQIRSSLVLLENKWTKKNLSLSVDMDEVNIKANEELLKQVWINILDNAIKFSNENGDLKITVQTQKGKAVVVIANQGVKISEQDKTKIFEKFYRANNTKNIEGSGVGLAIVKKIVDLHLGDIGIEDIDGYTAFIVTLPNAKII